MMDLHTLIEKKLDKNLKCFSCQNYLSYFPIYLCSNSNLCGRCALPAGVTCYQNEAFETICQFSKFPCRYNSEGCLEELFPKDIPLHEEICPFRVVSCIVNGTVPCTWNGSLPTLLHHCRSEHSNLMLKNGEFEMDPLLSGIQDHLVKHGDKLYIFSHKYDAENTTLHYSFCSIQYALHPDTCVAYLTIRTDGDKCILIKMKITPFEKRKSAEICLLSIYEKHIQNKSIHVRIDIGKIRSNIIHYPETENKNSTLLSHLKCASCGQFAKPPIYRRFPNMNISCSRCADLGNTKIDKILSDLAASVSYPCPYQENGCSYSSKFKEIKNHQKDCQYKIDECPFEIYKSCTWKGIKKEILNHILSNHEDIISRSSEEVFYLPHLDSSVAYKVIKYSNNLFRLGYGNVDGRFVWSVQIIGPCQQKFKYEIDFVDVTRNGRRLVTRQPCGELLTHEKDVFQYCSVNLEWGHVKDFSHWIKCNNYAVNFKVHIFN